MRQKVLRVNNQYDISMKRVLEVINSLIPDKKGSKLLLVIDIIFSWNGKIRQIRSSRFVSTRYVEFEEVESEDVSYPIVTDTNTTKDYSIVIKEYGNTNDTFIDHIEHSIVNQSY